MADTSVPRRALVLLGILTLVWGTNWPLFVLAVQELSVWTFRAVTVTLSGTVLLLIARARGQPLAIPRRHWPTIVAATFFYLIVWNVASTYAAVMIPSGQAAILGFTMPLWTALISWALLGEKMTRRLAAAVMLGACAVGLLMVPGLAAYARAPVGFALGLSAGLGWAIGSMILKRSDVRVPATVLTGWQLLVTAVPMTAGAVAFGDGVWFMPNWQTVVVLLYIALVPMGIGNVAWFSIAEMLPINIAGLSSILVPVVAMVSGALVHGEPLGLMQWSAMACCAAALALVLLPGRVR